MNISVECYEELYLKDKDAEGVKSEVENIRRQIARLKYEMEAPATAYERSSYRSKENDIAAYRRYLFSALSRLSEISGENHMTEEERAAALFDESCKDISKLSLTLGRYLERKHELNFGNGSASVMTLMREGEANFHEADEKEARQMLYDLHLGEWKENYLPEQYSCTLNEPLRWHLRVEYSGGAAPRFFEGIGITPYNFGTLCKLLLADAD